MRLSPRRRVSSTTSADDVPTRLQGPPVPSSCLWTRATDDQDGPVTDIAQGRLTGRLYLVGGPKGNLPRPVRGTVTIQGPHGQHQTEADKDGYYAAELPTGPHTVTATSPNYIINGLPGAARAEAIVQADETTTTDLFFQMK